MRVNNFLALGMQTFSNTSEIYTSRISVSINGTPVMNDTTSIRPISTEGHHGIAFTYTLVQAGKRIIMLFNLF